MILAFLVAAATAATAPPLEEAERAIAAGRYEQAQTMIEAAAHAGDSGERLDRARADLALARHADREAAARFSSLAQSNPGEAGLWEKLAVAALRSGQDGLASSAIRHATALPSASWRAWNATGVLADRQGQFAAAREAYRRALALAPGRAEALNNLGWSYLLSGDLKQSLPLLRQAAAAAPGDSLIARNRDLAESASAADLPARRPGEGSDAYAARLNDLGVAASHLGQRDKAAAAFAQAVAVRTAYFARAANNLAFVEGRR